MSPADSASRAGATPKASADRSSRTFEKNMKILQLLTVIFITTATTFADFVPMKFEISPKVSGLPKNTPLTFVKSAKAFELSIPISDGEKIVSPFTAPQDFILKSTWLQQTGQFEEYRLFLGKPSGLSEEMFTLITSDDVLNKGQESLKRYSTLEPMLLIEEKPEELYYLIYRLKGNNDSAIRISSFSRNSDGSYAPRGGELSSPEYKALFNGLVQESMTGEQCVSFKEK